MPSHTSRIYDVQGETGTNLMNNIDYLCSLSTRTRITEWTHRGERSRGLSDLSPDDFQQLPLLAHLLTSHKTTHQRNHTVSDQPVHTEELGERLRTCARAQ